MSVGILLRCFGGTRLGVWAIKHLASPLQRLVYQRTGGVLTSVEKSGIKAVRFTHKGGLLKIFFVILG